MAQPTILLAPEANHVSLDRVIGAIGNGVDTFSAGRRIVAAGTAGPVLYRLGLDMGADAAYATDLRAMAESQTLPSIAGTWGEGGVISAADAQAAMIGFLAFTAAGDGIDGAEWVDTVLSGRGLVFEPDEEGE